MCTVFLAIPAIITGHKGIYKDKRARNVFEAEQPDTYLLLFCKTENQVLHCEKTVRNKYELIATPSSPIHNIKNKIETTPKSHADATLRI